MTIALATAGGIMTRLGHLAGGIDDINALRGGTATARVLSTSFFTTRRNQIFTDFAAAPPNNNMLTTLDNDLTAWFSAQSGWMSAMQTLAQNTLVQMADDDTKLASKTVSAAMSLLIAQMTAAVASVNASSVAAGAQTSAVGVTPVGTAQIVTSVKAGNGKNLEYMFPETFTFTVTGDATGAGTATAGNEPLTVAGQASVSDVWSQLWPGGSGSTSSLNIVDGTKDQSAGNLLVNSNFASYTGASTDYPDNWSIDIGTVTTNVAKDATNFFRGATSVKLIGDGGGTLITISERFNQATSTTNGSGGTPQKLAARTPYAVGFWTRVSAVPAAGVLRVALVDGSNNVINDDNAVANSTTISLPGQTTSWAFTSIVFRLPANVPSTVKLQFKTTTAIDSAKFVNIGNVSVSKMTQLYTGGPFSSVIGGATNVVTGDAWTVAMTNTYGLLQKLFERLFGMRNLGLQLPSSGSPTISDSLIA